MTLQQLILSLLGTPEQIFGESMPVFVIASPGVEGEDFAGAIGLATVEVRSGMSIDKSGVFIGSTEHLRKSVAHLSKADILESWLSVCHMMGW
jgi:hypothetical protein